MAVNNPNVQNKAYVNPLEKVSKEELQTKLSAAQLSNNWKEAGDIINELQRREKPAETELDKFNQSYDELKKKVKSGKATKEELKTFFETDVKKYKSGTDKNVKEISEFKDKKIADLQKQLNDSVLDLPSIKDYFSLKRRRLVTMVKALDEFVKDKANYPKNFLIYCMGILNSSIFGARQKIKRGWISLVRRWKSDDIKGGLKTLEDKIQVTDKDTAQKKIIKQMIKEKLVDAKNAYIEKVREKVF